MYTIEEAEDAGLEEVDEIDTNTCSGFSFWCTLGFFKGVEIKAKDLVFYANAKTGVIKRHMSFRDEIITDKLGNLKVATSNGQVRLFLKGT